MKTFVTILLFTVLICGCLGNTLLDKYKKEFAGDEQLLQRKLHPRFTGGQPADWSEYPYVVAVTNGTVYRGGGVIIAENFILTLFATVLFDNPSDLKVLHGNIEKNVSDVIYSPDAETGSVALIKLEDKFDLSGPNISSIALRNESVPLGTNCTLVGVGGNIGDVMTVPEDSLRYIEVPIVDLEECNAFWSRNFTEGHLCTGMYQSEAYCIASYGDPLICDGLLTGVESILDMCNSLDDRAIFGDVAYYKDWIEQQISNN